MSYFQVITTMLTTGTDDPSLASARAIIKVLGHQYRWLVWWLWPENRTFSEVTSMVVTWWIVAFLHTVSLYELYIHDVDLEQV